MNAQHLATFSAIVRAGSISKAAAAQGSDKSVLSRQLARLESDLGARLVQRSTRRLTLTEIGEVVFAEAQRIEGALASIEQLTEQHQTEVKGRLRVTCPRPLGQHYLVPLIVEFTQRHPAVEVALTVDDRLVDLIAEHIDVAIRVAHLEDSSLIAVKLAEGARVLVASPGYVQRAGTPKTPADLARHECLVFTSGARVMDDWPFLRDGAPVTVRVQNKIQINDGMALVSAACAGGGVLAIDRFLAAKELASGALVELMPQFSLQPGQPIYAVYPARSGLALKTSTFISHLRERLFG